jgi:hypothetical protein
MADWKKFLFIGAGWGLGTAAGLALLTGGLLWYQNRPEPSKPWNTAALVGKEPPGFVSDNEHAHIKFIYYIQNTTKFDYQISSDGDVKVMARYKDGTLSAPLPTDVRHLDLPVFIPAHQTGELTLLVALSGIPEQEASESFDQYHERLRAYCEDHLAGVANFVLFDEVNRYEIDLPRWLAQKPKPSP